MELKDQVVSLELSKRLKELGVNHESYFNWCDRFQYRVGAPEEIVEPHLIRGNAGWVSDVLVPAYTVAELGEMLPARIKDGTWLNYTKSLNGWGGICERVSYDKWENHDGAGQLLIKHIHEVNSHPHRPHEASDHTLADLYARMLIYLIENKLITL